MAGALAGCLTPNPNLVMDSEGGEDSSSGDASGSPTSSPTTAASQTGSTTATSTTDGPTTDPDTTDTETSDTADTETTGPASCGSGNVCAPEVPGGGWAGPVIWAETATTDEPPACPGAYPEPAFLAYDDLQAPPAICDCDCGAASGASCASIVLEDHHDDSVCNGGAEEEFTVQAGGACNSMPNEDPGRYWNIEDPGVTGGNCAPIDSVEIPDLGWNSVSTVCGGGTPAEGVCGSGEACVAWPDEGFESRLCIWQPGNLECPNGDYGDRFVRHAEYTDGRNCQTCTCGNPTGSCSGGVALFASDDCTGSPSSTISIDGGCTRGATLAQYSVHSVRRTNLSVQNVSCEPSVGTAIGEAEPADPYTLCCISL